MESPPERPRPIYSSLADDPAQQDLIDAFVVALAERVDELQDCEARCEFERLRTRAEALGRHSREARKALIELTEVSQRVRLGHRGAA
jgi:hypothetical protein